MYSQIQCCSQRCLGMNKYFTLTLYKSCEYFSMLWSNLIHISKWARGLHHNSKSRHNHSKWCKYLPNLNRVEYHSGFAVVINHICWNAWFIDNLLSCTIYFILEVSIGFILINLLQHHAIVRSYSVRSYHQTSNISCILVVKKNVNRSDVVGASLVSAVPTSRIPC